MSYFKTRQIPIKAGEPRKDIALRPSVEYTGMGNLLVYDAWGGKFFRASEAFVRAGCEKFKQMYLEEENYLCYNDLYKLWKVLETDPGGNWGYSPSEDWKKDDLNFEYTRMGPGTELYDKFGEEVLVVEPNINSFPMESFWEV